MPGNPVAKSNNIDVLCKQFTQFATEFDSLLPSIYRFDGQQPGCDRRGNAWAKCDQLVVLTADALSELRDVLHKHAARSSTAYVKAETEANTSLPT